MDLKPKEVAFWEGRPINTFSEDQLGRKDFARFFAEAIARHNGSESLVLAVNAPWGEGKTSFKNMVVDLLAQEKADRVVILHFTPWEWSSQKQVSEAFFSEIAKQLELKDKTDNAKQAAARFRALGSYLGLAGQIIAPAGPFLEGGLPGSTIVTFALGKGLSKAREVAKGAAENLERAAEESKKSLPSIKEELRLALKDYLEKENKLVLVVVDDIDRLSPEEIRLVFQMVRVNADFPALVFLLLYDEEFVVSALEKFFGSASNKFLEKIVQFQASLPVLVDNRLRDHVGEELLKFFKMRPAYAELFDIERFHNLWAAGIVDYITNLRQAGRLLSSFQFHLGVFRSDEAEVNPLDFLVLEVFRLFEHKFYRTLYAKGDELFSGSQFAVTRELARRQHEKDPWDEKVTELLKEVKNESAGKLFKEVFSEQGFGVEYFGSSKKSRDAAGQRRVCHILYFNRYFRLTIDAGDIPDRRISELVNSISDSVKFSAQLSIFAKEKILPLALTKLLTRQNLKPSSAPSEMISEVCNFGDEAAEIQTLGAFVNPLEALLEIVKIQLDPSLKSSERFARLSDGIEKKYFGPHLERSDVEKLNEIVAERFEKKVENGALKLTPGWLRSIGWYLSFMRNRVKDKGELFLVNPTVIAAVLTTIIDDRVVSIYERTHSSGRFAEVPMFMAKHCFGFERLDKAIDDNEAELRKFGESVVKRIEIYRDMRENFSHLADPKPAGESENTEGD